MSANQAPNNYFNPAMIILARESRGLTQQELAEQVSLSQAEISRYENAMRIPSEEHIVLIADILDYPVSFFYQTERMYGLGSNGLHHRKQRSLPSKKFTALIARVNMLRFFAGRLLKGVDIDHFQEIPQYKVLDYKEDIERIAELIRATWKLPAGPVRDLVGLIENAGGIVHRTNFGTQQIDALVQWVPPSPPIVLVNEDFPGDRLRFTLAHELGHLVMHTKPTENIEHEADVFASALLMPAHDIAPDFAQVTLSHLAHLKPYWRVSIAALIRRAYDLQKITDRQYRSLHEEMGKLGYRTNEPLPIPIEKPSLLREMIDTHIQELGYTVKDLAAMASLKEEEFCAEYMPKTHNLRIVPPKKKPPKVAKRYL